MLFLSLNLHMLIPGSFRKLTTMSKKWRAPTDVELKSMVVIPKYLSKDMEIAVKSKGEATPEGPSPGEEVEAPTCPILVFINSKSGGRLGPELKIHFEELISSYQVSNFSDLVENCPILCRFIRLTRLFIDGWKISR